MAVNKVDNAMRDADAVEFYNLGMGDYYTISSINGSGTGELLDAIAEKLVDSEEEKSDLPRFAVVGLSLIHISEPTRLTIPSRMPSSD